MENVKRAHFELFWGNNKKKLAQYLNRWEFIFVHARGEIARVTTRQYVLRMKNHGTESETRSRLFGTSDVYSFH